MVRVTELGESLVVAGGETRLRVHIHTNEPKRFFATVAELAHIERTKVDDMVVQQLACRTTDLGLVTDSTTDLPEDEAISLGIMAVPLTLTLGDEEYLDGVDITLDGFIQRILAGDGVPRSSQPAVADLVQTYRRLLECRDGVVSVHIAAALSGTVQAARAAAREVDPERIRVIDSCSVSVGAGLLVEAVGEAITSGADLDEVERIAERVKREIKVFGAVKSLDFAVRGGRVSPRLAKSMDRLHLSPIIALDETGKAGRAGAALGFDRALNTIVRRVVRYAGDGPARAMVVHSGDQPGAEFVAARLARAPRRRRARRPRRRRAHHARRARLRDGGRAAPACLTAGARGFHYRLRFLCHDPWEVTERARNWARRTRRVRWQSALACPGRRPRERPAWPWSRRWLRSTQRWAQTCCSSAPQAS